MGIVDVINGNDDDDVKLLVVLLVVVVVGNDVAAVDDWPMKMIDSGVSILELFNSRDEPVVAITSVIVGETLSLELIDSKWTPFDIVTSNDDDDDDGNNDGKDDCGCNDCVQPIYTVHLGEGKGD